MDKSPQFRFWDPWNENMFYQKDHYYDSASLALFFQSYYKHQQGGNSPVLMQYTRLKDINDSRIYEDDVVRSLSLNMETQTHKGPNIPMGSYTEPIGVHIDWSYQRVEKREGYFNIAHIWEETFGYQEYLQDMPEDQWKIELLNIFNLPHSSSDESIQLEIVERVNEELDTDFKTLRDIHTAYEGQLVVGNVHSNPELIEKL